MISKSFIEERRARLRASLQKFSPIVQIGAHPERVPPLFVARAGKDEIPTLLESIDCFAAAALARNVPVTVMNHPLGPHGFNNQMDDDRSREIIRGAGVHEAAPGRKVMGASTAHTSE